jgi:hypothetical protein
VDGRHAADESAVAGQPPPLWDIVVITFMIGGTALCLTALVLAWRAVGKKLRPWTSAAHGSRG